MAETIGRLNKKYWIIRQPKKEWCWVLAPDFIPPTQTPQGITLISSPDLSYMFVYDGKNSKHYKPVDVKKYETE